MSDLKFHSFKTFMDDSHTEEGRKRQEADSMRSLITHGGAYDLEVDSDTDAQESSVSQPLTRAGQQHDDGLDIDRPPPAKPASAVAERWAALKREHGTIRFG